MVRFPDIGVGSSTHGQRFQNRAQGQNVDLLNGNDGGIRLVTGGWKRREKEERYQRQNGNSPPTEGGVSVFAGN